MTEWIDGECTKDREIRLLVADKERLREVLSEATEQLKSNLTITRKLRANGRISSENERWELGYERGLVEGLQALGRDALVGEIIKATAAESKGTE